MLQLGCDGALNYSRVPVHQYFATFSDVFFAISTLANNSYFSHD